MDNKFVSRGGLKLQSAIENWKLEIENCVALDVGSSTGGFVDCLLQNNASKVYSTDTSYGELAWVLRKNPKVVVMERTNILHLESLPEQVDLITIDAGWTKLELVLPVVQKFLKKNGIIIALLKPQYEAEKDQLNKGVVRIEELDGIVERVSQKIKDLGFSIEAQIDSPILGTGGNKEFLLKITI